MAHSQDGTYGSIGSAGKDLEVDREGSETDELLSSPSIKTHHKKLVCQIGVAVIVVLAFVFLRPGHTDPESRINYRPSYSPNGKREFETPRYYMDQIVDHNNPETSSTYPQKYFANPDFHGGPGHPIFVIIGGEDAVDFILYPFVSETLALKHSAYTMVSTCGDTGCFYFVGLYFLTIQLVSKKSASSIDFMGTLYLFQLTNLPTKIFEIS
jgi:hypothetical protein